MPNGFLTLAYWPDEFCAFFAYHNALMDKNGGDEGVTGDGRAGKQRLLAHAFRARPP